MDSTSAAAAPAPSSSSAASASTSAVPPSSSLFNTDENRFLQDTLASAHSFDPFQHGAPGFKVPAVLPPGLIQGMTANGSSSNSGWPIQPQDTGAYNAFPRPDRSRTNSWAPTGSHDSPVQGHNESFVAFVRRTQGNTPFSTTSSSQSPPHAPTQYHHQHSQSFSGPSTGGGGAYGQNMAWKMQQLEALQAERRRYMESVGGGPGSSGPPPEASTSTVSPMDYQSLSHPPHPPTSDAGPSATSPAHSRHSSHQSPPHPHSHPHPHASAADLSTLGLSFPSSHDFPPATPPGGVVDGGDQQMATLHQHHHHHQHSPHGPQLRGPIQRLKSGSVGRSSGGGGTGNNSNGSRSRQPSTSASTGAKAGSSADAQQTTAEYKPWPKAPSPSDPSTIYPPVHVDPSLVSRSLLSSNPALSRHADAFYGREPAEERRRFQPHLVDLKDRRREERKKKAEMMEEKKAKALARQQQAAGQQDTQADDSDQEEDDGDDSGDDDGGEGAKKRKSASSNGAKKPAHTLLTEAEKKANHIASEQKRRANIRKGYELLCQGVPALREALERGDEDGGNVGGQTSGDSMPTLEIGGEKIDGRAGPRSEAVVLGKSVEHLRHLLEVHRDLRSRRDHARVKLARARFGIDVVVKEDPNAVVAQNASGKGGNKGKKKDSSAAMTTTTTTTTTTTMNGSKKKSAASGGKANGKDKAKASAVKVEEGGGGGVAGDEANSMDVS